MQLLSTLHALPLCDAPSIQQAGAIAATAVGLDAPGPCTGSPTALSKDAARDPTADDASDVGGGGDPTGWPVATEQQEVDHFHTQEEQTLHSQRGTGS